MTHTAEIDAPALGPLTEREAMEQMERTRAIIGGWQRLTCSIPSGGTDDA